jgi:thiol-disulfide isomerase/thioredoxin
MPSIRSLMSWMTIPLVITALAGCAQPSGGGSVAQNTGSPSATNGVSLQNTTNATTADRHFPANRPFENRLNALPTTPANVLNAKPADPAVYASIPALTPEGASLTLTPSERPVVFVAYWCPHCQRTLVLWDQHWSELSVKPVIVATGFEPGTPLAQAKQIDADEIRGLNLKHIQFDAYLLDTNIGKKVIQAYPEVVFQQGDQLLTVTGERTLAVWKQVLS